MPQFPIACVAPLLASPSPISLRRNTRISRPRPACSVGGAAWSISMSKCRAPQAAASPGALSPTNSADQFLLVSPRSLLESWAFWGAAMLMALYAFSALYTLFVQHAALFSLHQSLLLSIAGLIYMFTNRDVRAAFFNT